MNKINFATVYNDFGGFLPENRDEFFNNPKNEVSREMVKSHYNVRSGARAYAALQKDYAVFVASLKKGKDDETD